MKKIFLCIVLIMGAVFAGCSDERVTSEKDGKFLTSAEYWWFYDEVTDESEKMSFGEDLSFYWGCQCGEPIGESDLYELYDYDKETQIIKLYNGYDDTSMEMKVLDYNDYYLILEVDGRIKGYTSSDGMGGEAYFDKAEEYLAGYSMYASFIEFQGSAIRFAPYDYDGDVEYPDDAFRTYEIAENIEFYDLQIKTVQDVDSGQEAQDVVYNKVSLEDAIAAIEHSFGFVWFNDDMEIEKIVFYGAVIIQE